MKYTAIDPASSLPPISDSTTKRWPAPKVHLIPWDPDSPEHVERMRLQRVACGWKAELVKGWAKPQRKGTIGLYWIVLSPSDPLTPSRLSSHWQAYPEETSPLMDSVRIQILGKSHAVDPELTEFHPVGHISLDVWMPASPTEVEYAKAARSKTPENGELAYALNTFFVSRVLQNCGLGGAAMTECERMAKEELGAQAITLNTIAPEEVAEDSPTRIKTGRPVPKISNFDWYSRRGYTLYERRENAWQETDAEGNRHPIACVYMRKQLA